MGKCLVKTYSGSVFNDTLERYNEISFTVRAGKTVVVNMGSIPDTDTYLRIVGNGDIKVNNVSKGKTYTFPASGSGDVQIVATGDVKAFINCRYNRDYFSLSSGSSGIVGEIDMDELKYASPSTGRTDNTFQIKNFKIVNVLSLLDFASYAGINFTIDSCETDVNLETVCVDDVISACLANASASGLRRYMISTTYDGETSIMPYINSSILDGYDNIGIGKLGVALHGDIKYLANIKTSGNTNTYFQKRKYGAYTTGSIEGLVGYAQNTLGKSTGKINLEYPDIYVNVTLGGTPLPDHSEITSNNKSFFTWDAQGNVTFGNN